MVFQVEDFVFQVEDFVHRRRAAAAAAADAARGNRCAEGPEAAVPARGARALALMAPRARLRC